MIQRVCDYFGRDGLLHLTVSVVAVVFLDIMVPLWVATLIAALLGVAKDLVWDLLAGRGSFDMKDLVADAAGVAVGTIIAML